VLIENMTMGIGWKTRGNMAVQNWWYLL